MIASAAGDGENGGYAAGNIVSHQRIIGVDVVPYPELGVESMYIIVQPGIVANMRMQIYLAGHCPLILSIHNIRTGRNSYLICGPKCDNFAMLNYDDTVIDGAFRNGLDLTNF